MSRKIAYIDLTAGNVEYKDISTQLRRKYLGGRGLNMYLLNELVGKDTNPMGAENPLVFGVGLLTGTPGYGTGRMNISARSPQSGYLGDSNIGGDIGERIYTTERLFINKLGLGRKDDTLPRRYFEEKVSSGLGKDAYIDEARFQQMLDEYYELHGWDIRGKPTSATLSRLGIS